jgi:transglutaminase-like putative cysteine protease
MALRIQTILTGFSAVAVFAVLEAPRAQTQSTTVKTFNSTVYQIKMTTTFVVPAGNDKINQVRVYHALPTLRPWSQSRTKFGATNSRFTPNTAKKEYHAPTDSHYLLWTVNGQQKPGTKLTFVSTMTVSSPDRYFNPRTARVKWEDYATRPRDKAAVVDPAVVKAIHPELAKTAARFKADYSPPEAVQAMCRWIVDTIKYDASVTFAPTDVDRIVLKKCGHCGHQATVLRQLTASAGIPIRTVSGMNLYAPDGRTSDLQKVRADFTNIHTWAEVYFPGIGWVEADPGLGAKAFSLPAHQIQNNRWFQNYSIWLRESGVDKQPTWTPVKGGFRSDYGVEHIISYSRKQ